jgi:SNF2 family DNA or RNA helicase
MKSHSFIHHAKLHVHHGASRAFNFKDAQVVLTTYDMIRTDAKEFAESKFHVIIFDEAQAIKNIYAKRTNAARQLNGVFKICLTGTPLENHIGEYYSIMDLALPGLFPPYKEFQSEAKNDSGQFLLKRSKPFILRRTKADILKDLPPKIESDLYLEMEPSQKSLYARTVAQIKNLVLDAYESKSASQAGIIALTALLRLRQICITGELVKQRD